MKQYKNTVQSIQNTVNASTHITKTPTHYKTHTYTNPHITKPTHTQTHTLQNSHIHTPRHYNKTNTVQDIPK